MKCPTCGRWNKRGEKEERRRLIHELALALGWDYDAEVRMYQANGAINMGQLRDLLLGVIPKAR